MGVETGLILAASLIVIAAFAAPWLWPAIDRSRIPAQPGQAPEPEEHEHEPVPFEVSRDDVVLRLRDSGLTYRRIAERLSGDFGQRMSPSTARRIWLRAHGTSRRGPRRHDLVSR
ncbi:MAG: hypothetical protein ACHQEA_11220 [Gaiellales bacterium]|jgi:hypothetical protein